jgi:hypothetical protein
MASGLSAPWTSWDDARFWLWLLWLATAGALAIVVVATMAWALAVEPGLAWWRGDGLRVVTDGGTWRHWLRLAAAWGGALAVLFLLILAGYCDGMLKGSGKAES